MIAYKKKGDFRRKSQHKTHVHVLKAKTYQLSRLVKIVVADEHPVFGHALEGFFIQIVGKEDKVLLNTSHHKYLEKSGVEVAHACDQRLPLVKGASIVNDFPISL